MAGCFGGRNLPFKIRELINKYKDPLSEFGADEYLILTEHLLNLRVATICKKY